MKTVRYSDDLDEIDIRMLELLRLDSRMPNSALARELGIAPSTAHARLRALISRGIVVGFTTVIDQRSLGQSLQAVVGITLRPGARQESITRFSEDVRKLPSVLQVFFLGGVDDFIVHVAVSDSSALREFVLEHLSGHTSVASTRTSIVFDYHRNGIAGSFQ